MEVHGWPQGLLTVPPSGREGYVFPAASLSASFQKSLSNYLAFLANPPDDDDAPFRGLRPTTLRRREFQFRQMASALVHGGAAVEAITGITALASQDNVTRSASSSSSAPVARLRAAQRLPPRAAPVAFTRWVTKAWQSGSAGG
jgi:hypothetical protein